MHPPSKCREPQGVSSEAFATDGKVWKGQLISWKLYVDNGRSYVWKEQESMRRSVALLYIFFLF